MKPSKTCACSLRTRLVGDGCGICNPELAAELVGQEGTETKPSKAAERYVDSVCWYLNTWSDSAIRTAIARAYDAGRRAERRRAAEQQRKQR